MTLESTVRAITLATLLGLVPVVHALAEEAWVRFDRPSAALRAQLPSEAIDYGAFVWMPERVLPASARSFERVHRIERPFAMPLDGRRVDLSDQPAGRSAGEVRRGADHRGAA
ncbi:MAG: hypothetical protein ACLFTM_10190, partial [Ectothiorhodospira sp.]